MSTSDAAFLPRADLAGASILTLRETPDAVPAVIETARWLKGMPRASWPALLAGKPVALIFERPSTRTRVSFDVGVRHLGGHPLTLNSTDLQMGRGETIRDTALVLSRMVSAVVLRTGPHAVIDELARHATVPVINGLTYEHHPCQGLADVLTISERFPDTRGVRVAYLGDGNNVCVSLMIAGAAMGMDVVAACPEGYRPPPAVVEWAAAFGAPRAAWWTTPARPPWGRTCCTRTRGCRWGTTPTVTAACAISARTS